LKALSYFLRYTDWVNEKFGWFVAFLMLPTLIVMMWEVVMRYFFNSPSLWAYEISLFMYGSYIALCGLHLSY